MSRYIHLMAAGTLGIAAAAAALTPPPSAPAIQRMAEVAAPRAASVAHLESALERAACLMGIRTTQEGGVTRIALDLTREPAWWMEPGKDATAWTLHLGNTISLAGAERQTRVPNAYMRIAGTTQLEAAPWFCSTLQLRVADGAGLYAQWNAGALELTAVRGQEGAPLQGQQLSSRKAGAICQKLQETLSRYEDAYGVLPPGGAHALAEAQRIRHSIPGEEAALAIEQMVHGFLPNTPDRTRDHADLPVAGDSFREVTLAQLDIALKNFEPLAATESSPAPESAAEEAQTTDAAPQQSEADSAPIGDAPPPPPTRTEAKAEPPSLPKAVRPVALASRPTQPFVAGDPLYAPVTVDLREAELSDVVALWAQKAQINVVAGTDVEVAGTVSVYLQEVPLIRALETVLRLNNLGLVEEDAIYRIVPYEEAVSERRISRTLYLRNAQAKEVANTLDSVAQGLPDGTLITIAPNESTNVIILSGPERRIDDLQELAYELDVAEPTINTVTKALKLNYAQPGEVAALVEPLLSVEEGTTIGSVQADERSRQVIVTDVPIVIEQISALVEEVDKPVKLVSIESMIVNAVLRDNSQTGVNWLLDLVREHDSAGNVVGPLPGRVNTRGEVTGSTEDLNMAGNLGNVGADALDAGILSFHVLTGELDLRGAIAAEVASSNADILANPVVTTLENKEAQINIVTEYPYQEITQSTQGPPVSSTEFKEIGIELRATPRVTHDNDILVDLFARESSIQGLTADGIPIEDARSATTNLRTGDGQTIFIGGLRDVSHRNDISKIPVLGDIPVMNFMFRTTDIEKIHSELLIFLTCRVIEERMPELTPYQRVEHDRLSNEPQVPNTQKDLFRSLVKPNEMRDPVWKWRRTP